MYFFLVALIIGLCFGALIFLIFSPKSNTSTMYLSKSATIDPKLRSAVNMIGGDVLALLPDDIKRKKSASSRMQQMFTKAANPWNLSVMEFWIIQLVLALFGAVVGSIVVWLIQPSALLTFAIIGVSTFAAYNYPALIYENAANDRESQFRRYLPEGIDYLVMALSGGASSLQSAFERAVKYMPHNVVRAEFEKVVHSTDTGKSMTQALNELEERVPTEGIQAFVKALNNAHQHSAPLASILRQRADSSRADLKASIERKIITLPTKAMLVVGPVAYVSILIVAVAPTAMQLMQALGV